MTASNSNLKTASIISLLFLVSVLPYLFIHELWRDEVQAWSLAIKSHSLADLFYNSRYEGHPKLWFILLYGVQKFTSDIFYMQILHLLIATASVFIFCYFSPLKTIQNILFCFGYYFFYEYTAISRNYGIEMLLLFLSAGLYIKRKQQSIITISVLLFLVSQTNAFGMILSIVFAGYIFLCVKKQEWRRLKNRIAVLITLSGSILSFVSSIPPSDGGYYNAWTYQMDENRIRAVIGIIFRSFLPAPQFINQFWNTNIVDEISPQGYLSFFLSLVLLACCFIFFFKRKNILIFFFSGTTVVLVFNYIKYFGVQRHHGHIYILFILCCWIYFSEIKNNLPDQDNPFLKLIKRNFLTFILILQVVCSAVAWTLEFQYPFSNAQAVAGFLKHNSLSSMNITADKDAQTSSIAGIMNKDFYYLQFDRWGTYIPWDKTRQDNPDYNLVKRVEQFSEKTKNDFILILSYKPDSVPLNWFPLKHWNNAIQYDENYWAFKVKYNK